VQSWDQPGDQIRSGAERTLEIVRPLHVLPVSDPSNGSATVAASVMPCPIGTSASSAGERILTVGLDSGTQALSEFDQYVATATPPTRVLSPHGACVPS
jgi:hypothetical protein